MRPRIGYFLGEDGLVWDGKTIAINDETRPEECLGFEKTLYFLSNTIGTLTIYVDAVGDGDFQTYNTVAIVANVLAVYPMTGGARHVKVSFSAVAIVTAKFVFE